MSTNDTDKQYADMSTTKIDTSSDSKDQILIDRFADLMIDRLFQDIDKDKKLYTKLQ
jgi:hypothetical protein